MGSEMCIRDRLGVFGSWLDKRTKMSVIRVVTGNEFIRKVRKLGRANKVTIRLVVRRGKGSHGTLFYGSSSQSFGTPSKTGTLRALLDQLGINDL